MNLGADIRGRGGAPFTQIAALNETGAAASVSIICIPIVTLVMRGEKLPISTLLFTFSTVRERIVF